MPARGGEALPVQGRVRLVEEGVLAVDAEEALEPRTHRLEQGLGGPASGDLRDLGNEETPRVPAPTTAWRDWRHMRWRVPCRRAMS